MKSKIQKLSNSALWEISLALLGASASIITLGVYLEQKIGPFFRGLLAAILGAAIATAMGIIFDYLRRRKPRVFISYAHQDTEFATEIARNLKNTGAEPVIDRLVLQVGDSVQGAVDKMIDTSDYFLFIVSPASFKSPWAQKEVQQALSRKKRILPVVLDKKSIPKELAGIFYADFTEDKAKGLAELEKTIHVGSN